MSAATLPVIDVGPLRHGTDPTATARAMDRACRESGFFYVTHHGVPPALLQRLEELSRRFFELPESEKQVLRMNRFGPAWRGWFPVGTELTSGRPDQKEGLYFGAELAADDPRVVAGLPLHGANPFPAIDGFRETVLEYLAELLRLGRVVMRGLALALGLQASYFEKRYTADPLILFRIFSYPPLDAPGQWSVAEHTDYGLLTLLLQDDCGGLEVRGPDGWIEAPPLEGSFVCNLGDMLDRLTGGAYLSTPHRVRNTSDRTRLSFPFFFDPAFDAVIEPLPQGASTGSRPARWDGRSLDDVEGTYGTYLMDKVGRVFPGLRRELDRE